MNRFKAVYCRTYQTVFKIALPFLPYRKPKLLADMKHLVTLLQKKKKNSILLVTDESVRRLHLTQELENLLKENNITCTVYDQTVANPTTENVEAARLLYLNNSCKAIIGFGGGSSMDCAKAVGARVVKPRQSLAKMEGILHIHHRLPLLIAIPTTAGTGSETTLAAVITDAQTRHKYPINDFCLIPSYTVLDPMITRSLPPALTASTGMDALTHAVEAYIGNSTTPGTRKDALKAIRLIFANLQTAYTDGNNLRARKNMLYASYLAGAAFTKSYVGYVHAVAHSLGGEYNIPHGLANAVLLPFVLEAYGESIYKKLHTLAVVTGLCDESENPATGAQIFIWKIKEMKKKMNIGNTFSEIRKEDIPKLSHYADKEANPLYPVPVLMDAAQLEQFYYLLMEN